MDLKKVIDDYKKEFLTPYCLEVCGSKCCNLANNPLEVTAEQLVEIYQKDFKTVLKEHKIRRVEGLETYFIDEVCPLLEENRCNKYDSRPEPCKNYPIYFLEGDNRVILHKNCPFVAKKGHDIVDELKQKYFKPIYPFFVRSNN